MTYYAVKIEASVSPDGRNHYGVVRIIPNDHDANPNSVPDWTTSYPRALVVAAALNAQGVG
jgi:hypothetical protein